MNQNIAGETNIPRIYDFLESNKQILTKFEPTQGISWVYMNPQNIPCFNRKLLSELREYHVEIEKNSGQILHGDKYHNINYLVLASNIPGVFNLGGQLSLFRDSIKNGDRHHLLDYATMCIDAMANRINHCQIPATTISLVQGDAMGGGFEAALTSDIIIAERSAKMGFPEILFNLFPGMGAFSFISRKIGVQTAQEMMLNGKIYTAEELFKMRLVDVVAEDGEGEDAVYKFVSKQSKRANGFHAVQKAKHRLNPVSYEELIDITKIWVDAALKLGDRDIKIMERLISTQEKFLSRIQQAPQPPALRYG
jgi:DSF synthase